MSRRRLADQSELDAHLEWLRLALHDHRFDARLVLEGVLDALELLAAAGPGPPRGGEAA